MTHLENLKNTSRKSRKRKRVGRGTGSGHGKTCGRGHKGMGSRSGSTQRYGYEGGQFPLYMKLPTRGFSNARFQKKLDVVNLRQLEKIFQDGDEVTLETLRQHGLMSGPSHGVKLLGEGELTKKLACIKVDAISQSAKDKLAQLGIEVKLLSE